MKWFEGSIPEAIQLAKTRKCVFIVYVEGTDDNSKEMSDTWEGTEDEFDEEAVCLKLSAISDVCRQFSQIYPVIVVPSTFFIALDGTPLEILGGNKSLIELLELWTKVKQVHAAQQLAAASSSPQLDFPPPAPSSVSQPSTSTPSAQAQLPEQPLDERVELAKDKLERKRLEKLQKEREEAKRKDKEARELGKNVTKLKQWQKDQAEKEAMSEWKKDKEETKKYREKVKQEIARDREERAARFQKDKADRDTKQEAVKAEKQQAQTAEQAKQEATKRETARIQFRLPDGSSFNEQFASSETLGVTRTFLRAKLGNQYGNFTLSVLYPKRTFVEEDMTSTLLDLELAPSAILIVHPSSSMSISTTSVGGGVAGGVFWMLLAPFVALWNFLRAFIFASPPAPSSQPPSASSSRRQTPSSSADNTPQSSLRKRPKTSHGVRSRTEGNIRRFTADDEDDDNATWNGNSTQQM